MNAVNFFAEVLLALFLSVVTAHFWLVPAKVAGTWQMSEDEIALKQTFQEISGALRSGGNRKRKAREQSNNFHSGRYQIHRPIER